MHSGGLILSFRLRTQLLGLSDMTDLNISTEFLEDCVAISHH